MHALLYLPGKDLQVLYPAARMRLVQNLNEVENASYLVCSSEDEDYMSPPKLWTKIGSVSLSVDDKRALSDGNWLNDLHITAAQILLKENHEVVVGGLQSPQLGRKLAFDASFGDMVQILNSGDNHWITVSTVGLQATHVRVYDSLCTNLPFDTKEQIASLVQCSTDTLEIEYANVQVGFIYSH